MGTPGFAVPVLDALVAAGHAVVAVYSQPPRRAGRGKALTPSAVHARADALGIPAHTPLSLRDADAQAIFAGHDADVAVVAAYGLILPQVVLDAPRHGCLNVHASLLPRWRGAAPIQRAILSGDAETGVGIMQMEAGLDTGPVRLEGRTPVDGKTAGELTEELSALGAILMVEVLANLNAYPPIGQPDEGVTHAPKIDKAETRLDFTRSAEQVERQVRAFHPLAWFEVAGERVRVLHATTHARAGGSPEPLATPVATLPPRVREGTVVDTELTIACSDGVIRPTLVQRAGGRAMTTAELLRGFSIPAGTQL